MNIKFIVKKYKLLAINYLVHIFFSSFMLMAIKAFADKDLLFNYVRYITNFQITNNITLLAIPGFILIKKGGQIRIEKLTNKLIYFFVLPTLGIGLIFTYLNIIDMSPLEMLCYGFMSIIFIKTNEQQVCGNFKLSILTSFLAGFAFYCLPLLWHLQKPENYLYLIPSLVVLSLILIFYFGKFSDYTTDPIFYDFIKFAIPATIISFINSYLLNYDRLIILRTGNKEILDRYYPFVILGLIFLAVINFLSFIWGFISVDSMLKKESTKKLEILMGIAHVVLFTIFGFGYWIFGLYNGKFKMVVGDDNFLLLYPLTFLLLAIRSIFNTYINYYRKQHVTLIFYSFAFIICQVFNVLYFNESIKINLNQIIPTYIFLIGLVAIPTGLAGKKIRR